MPRIRWTFDATSDSRSSFTTGIAAQTEASKRSWTPPSAAAAKRSGPERATSCLFAVTTGTPRRSSSRTYAPVGSSPPITSATSRTSESSRIEAKSSVSVSGEGA